jgi:hypothetical protein
MFTNRFSKVVIALIVVAVALATASMIPAGFTPVSVVESKEQTLREYQLRDESVVIPVTGESAYPDYFQRHPELSVRAETAIDTTDYFFRHPELRGPARSVDLTDYYFRHPGQ